MKFFSKIIPIFLLFLVGLRADTSVDQEPILRAHSIKPFINVRNYKFSTERFKSRAAMPGIGYRYFNEKGYNALIEYSFYKEDHKFNGEFLFENSFRMPLESNLSLFPCISYMRSVYSLPLTPTQKLETSSGALIPAKNPDEKYRTAHIVRWLFGFGLEKTLKNNLTIGIKPELSIQSKKDVILGYPTHFHGTNHDKNEGYLINLIFRYKFNYHCLLEIMPYFGEGFKEAYKEYGSNISFYWVF